MVFAGAALAAALFLCPGTLLPTTLAWSPTRGAPPPAAWPPPRISTQQLRQYYQKIVVTGAASSSSAHPGATLHELLHDSGGVLRIAVGGEEEGHGFAALRRRALGGLCDCPVFPSSSAPTAPTARGRATTRFEEALRAHPRDLQEIALPDGAVRRTLASATVGFDGGPEAADDGGRAASLALPAWVEGACGRDTYDAFERVRDVVADVADLFVARLDRERTSSEGRPSYRELLAGANHLEHFHVYTKASAAGPADGTGDAGEEDARGRESAGAVRDDRARRVASEGGAPTLDYHTDAGFFLAFVPALDCRTRRADAASFFLHGRDDAPAAFGDDEVVILMGAGARHGLPVRAGPARDEGGGEPPPFRAASHALRLAPGAHRAWYGKMHLLPSSSSTSGTDARRSAAAAAAYEDEVRPSFQLHDYNAHVPQSPVDGCGTTVLQGDSLSALSHDAAPLERSPRRRLQHVNSPAQCDNVTNFFCWYQCRPIPLAYEAEEYVRDGYSLYCLDPSKLSGSSPHAVADATDPCKNGYVHNSNCIGSWQRTDPHVPGYELPYEVKEEQDQNQNSSATSATTNPVLNYDDVYCSSGTSMYMDGFNWQGSTCVIYLFQAWTLSTPVKFALAAIGSILLGIVLEFVLWQRRSVYDLPPGKRRLVLSSLVYGVQLSLGYFIMLVIMTYSGPLFLCTVGGMMLGHAGFNAQDSLAQAWTENRRRRKAGGGGGAAAASENGCCHGGELETGSELSATDPTENTNLTSHVGDGATPCCQYGI